MKTTNTDGTGGCRTALGRLLDKDESKDSDDIALRQAYYNGLVWHQRSPDDVEHAFEKDKENFLEVVVGNDLIYANEDVRKAFSACCDEYTRGDNDMYYSFSARRNDYQEKLEQEHPEWFTEFGEDPRFDLVSDLQLRNEKRLVFLQNKIKKLENAIIAQKQNPNSETMKMTRFGR